jgi:hypothetical protein
VRTAYPPGLVYDSNMFDEQGLRHEQPCQTNLETAMRVSYCMVASASNQSCPGFQPLNAQSTATLLGVLNCGAPLPELPSVKVIFSVLFLF